jgi:hypothetical protein
MPNCLSPSFDHGSRADPTHFYGCAAPTGRAFPAGASIVAIYNRSGSQKSTCSIFSASRNDQAAGDDARLEQMLSASLTITDVERSPWPGLLYAKTGYRHPHSITSSAVASSEDGMSRPSAFAVLRLITKSNLVGCSTGRSEGFVPLRIRPTYTRRFDSFRQLWGHS